MDSGEGGGDGGGGEERDAAATAADLHPQPLSPPLLTPEVIPEQGSSSHTSAVAPAKESLAMPLSGPQGAEGSPAGEQTQGGAAGAGGGGGEHVQGSAGCQDQGMMMMKEEEEEEEGSREGCLFELGTGSEVERAIAGEEGVFFKGGLLPAALQSRDDVVEEEEEEEEENTEEAISNQSQTKSKCSLLPQLSQHSSSSSTAMAPGGTLDGRATALPKPCLPPPPPPRSPSPKHFSGTPSSAPLPSETEVRDIEGERGWISGFPLSFKSQQSVSPSPPMRPSEDDGPAGVPHSATATEGDAKAPEPNDSQPERETGEEDGDGGDGERAVLRNLNHDLSPGSLTSHMTIMHSRNSCKTLKCPKCNWHYKSQHTLQLHMREKHPETGGQCVCAGGGAGGKCVCGCGTTGGACSYCASGKAHPRLARGETYACGYKPYRCEVCDYATSSKGNLSIHMQSDKHLNNVQSGGHANANGGGGGGGGGGVAVSQSHSPEEQVYKLALPLHAPPASQPAKLAPPPLPQQAHSAGKRWRCDVCDYETSIARNLRIHTTSEKHTHNMLRLQRGFYLSHCRSLPPGLKHLQSPGGELPLGLCASGQAVPDVSLATLGSTLTPSPSPSPSPPLAPPLSPAAALSPGVFHCLVCSGFSSDSLEAVEQHLAAPRSLPQAEWCSLVAGGCHCRLCAYTTPLRANFSLHCQTDRHRARYQLAAHMREGGDRAPEEGAALVAKGNPVQLRCNLCDYVTSSLEKLRGHALSSHHEASVRVYRFLQQYDGDVDGGVWLFHCLLCNHSSSSKVQLLKHSQTATHQQREGLLQLQPMGGEELAAIFTIRKCPDSVRGEMSEDMETSSETNEGPPVQTKDTRNLGVEQNSRKTGDTRGMEREKRNATPPAKRPSSGCEETKSPPSPKRPKIHQQNENQQTAQCALCQVRLPFTTLRQHLTYVHSVAQDCVDKLISAVAPSMEQLETQPQMDYDYHTDIQKNNSNNNINTNGSNSPTTVENMRNTEEFRENAEANEATPKDVTALLTPPLEEPTSHPPNSRPSPPSPSHHPPSSPPNSPPSDPPPPSDRHGYRFRCSRCSLAFPTHEKLQVHWQYHAMRAATECPLCARRCRSQEALQRHMQNTHSQLDSANPQNALLPSHTPQTQLELTSVEQDIRLSPQVGEEADEEEDDDMEAEVLFMEKKDVKTEEKKMEGKEAQVGVSGAQENILDLGKCLQAETGLEPTPNFFMKKGSNPTMDRYLDPARPYKCTICSESFTQKTILLVHFNSVSHLHRARRALQESGPGQANPEPPRGPDPRPYRCRLCGVGYSQSSTLDIHLRSVLHQTRARASQNAAPQIPAFGSAALGPVHSTTAQTAVTSEGTSKSLPLAKKADPVAPSISSLISTAADAQQALHSQAESQLAKRSAELLSSRNQILLMQQHQLAQAQAQLQQHTSLLQSQLFNPALLQHLQLGPESLLKQHFSIAPDNLLSLQQQLLLPFYLSGEMKLNPELVLKSLELNQADSCITALMEQLNPKATRESTPHVEEKPTQRQTPTSAQSQLNESAQSEGKVKACSGGSVMTQIEQEYNIPGLKEEKKEGTIHVIKAEKQRDETNQVDCSPHKRLGLDCPPPRVPYAAVNGEPLRTLLQSYGYELALQYIQSRQRHQLKINHMVPEGHKCLEERQAYLDMRMKDYIEFKAGKVEGCEESLKGEGVNGENIDGSLEKKKEKEQETLPKEEKEKCLDCGKMFSDALVLKTHQEYIHRQLFPTAVLEKFSKEYRLQYDQLYPLAESKSEETSADAPPTPKPDSEPEPVLEPGEQKPATDSEPKAKMIAPVTDLPPTTPVNTPSPSPQPQASPKHEGPLPSPSLPEISQTPSQGMGLPKLSLPLPQFPLSSLPLPPMSFPMDMPLLPSVVMQSMGLQSQPWLDSGLTSDMAKLYQSQLSPTLLSQQTDLGPALLAQQSQMNNMMLAQSSHHSPVLQHPQGTSTMVDQQQGKRPRTRISEEQLGVLRQHFDINSLPGDEDVMKMSSKCGLPHKVIKHWFRNTLFKERQRDKDSPYNFNNPPTTVLDEPQEEVALLQVLTEAASSISPGLPTNHSPQPQRADPHRGEPNRGRRSSRTRFTEQQLESLQSVFEATPYPREEEYDRLSALLSLPNRVIVVWFQNARQRARKSQEKGEEDGTEGRDQVEDAQRRSRGGHKNDTDDDCGEEGHGDRQNENSMDLAYEYYTHADSPVDADSPTHRTESKHEIVNRKKNMVGKMQDETAAQAEKIHAPVETQNEIPEADKQNQNKACTRVIPTPKPQPKPELPSEKPQHTSGSSSDRPIVIPTSSQFSQDNTRPSSAPAIDRPAQSPRNLPSECETDRACMPDTTMGRSAHLHQQNSLQHQTPTQFQCSFCPMSLPSPQLWQEHQTRHLLAAQSQVQLMHPGFSDRTMPYMMIHPNQTLMASQLLASAMSQMHPNPAHPMLPQMNGLHLNNTLSDHLSNSLSGLPHSSMSSGKQSSKVLMNDVSCEAQGGGREVEEDQRRDKRQRTTITPEQLEVLYQRYSMDSNPTRGVLESIARDVGLKRRVVQVWFQNTRARERKGQFRSTTTGTSFSLGLNHLRCLFCRALFKVKSALDAHIRSRHWAEAERAGYNLSASNGSASQLGMSMSSLLDNAGPSAPSGHSPNPGFVMSTKDRLARPLMPSHCSAIEPNSPEDEGAYEEEEEYPCDEGSSVAEQGSLSPDGIGGPSGDWGETLSQRQYQHQQQQRQRTQMSHFQVLQLRDFYRSHRTPNRQECEALGQDLGLPHRVVQVWFQNARAKEKRARSMSSDSADREQSELSAGAGERDRA